jgi:plastocyanin
MKRSNALARWFCCSVITAGLGMFSTSGFGAGGAATAITIVDQDGREVPDAQPSATSQIFDVTVGPNGMLQFLPSTVNISVGDTVRWTWGSSFHSVTSGNPCTVDGQFCSPNDMNCASGTLSNVGAVYQHTFTQAGTYSYFCFSHCSFGMTGTVNVTSAPMAQSAFSRKTHGGAGTFDIEMPLTGTSGVECRSGGATHDYSLMVNFSGNVTVTGMPQSQVVSGTGCIGSGGTCDPNGTVSVSGSVVTVPLTNIADVQVINVQINGVNGAGDEPAVNVNIPMGFLIGDVNGNRAVNASDVALDKSQVGQPVGAGNFREDVNTSGTISATDVSIVKSDVGHALPP